MNKNKRVSCLEFDNLIEKKQDEFDVLFYQVHAIINCNELEYNNNNRTITSNYHIQMKLSRKTGPLIHTFIEYIFANSLYYLISIIIISVLVIE